MIYPACGVFGDARRVRAGITSAPADLIRAPHTLSRTLIVEVLIVQGRVHHPQSAAARSKAARAEAIGTVGASVLRHKSFRLDSAEDIDPYGGRASIAR